MDKAVQGIGAAAGTDGVTCSWCAAIQRGDSSFPAKLELGWCAEHKAVWLNAATAALALARRQITAGKWRAYWSKAQAQAIRVAGRVPRLLPGGGIGVVAVSGQAEEV